MSSEPVAPEPERLSIPLQKSLERIGKEGRISLKNLGGTGFMLLFTVFLFYLCMNAKPAALIAPILFSLLVALGIRGVWLKISCARKLLAIYDGAGVPSLTLDSRGFTCPVLAMNYRAALRYLKDGQNSVQVKWDDLELFWDRKSSYSARGTLSPGMYMMRTKAKDNDKPKVVLIERSDFSGEEQDNISRFARRFLPTTAKIL